MNAQMNQVRGTRGRKIVDYYSLEPEESKARQFKKKGNIELDINIGEKKFLFLENF